MTSGDFILSDGPLALVVAQVELARAPELAANSDQLQSVFKAEGLPIAEQQQQANITVSPSQPVQVKSQSVWFFSDPERKEGVSVSVDSYSFITTAYTDFDAFTKRFNKVTNVIVDNACEPYFRALGLRYLNIFVAYDLPSDFLCPGLHGFPLDSIKTSHYHHNYDFWCDTDEGRLVVRCRSTHGDQSPKDLGHAGYFFQSGFDKSDNVYHLDIFENTRQRSTQQQLSDAVVEQHLRSQHGRIEQAFLNCTTDEARRAWGAKPK